MGGSKPASKRLGSSKSSNASTGSRSKGSRTSCATDRRKQSKQRARSNSKLSASARGCSLPGPVVRSSFILAEPKMQALQMFVRKALEPSKEPTFDETESMMESFGDIDQSPSRSDWESFDASPLCRMTSKDSRRMSASSRRMSALTKTASSRRTSATSTRRQSTETDVSNPSGRLTFQKPTQDTASIKLARRASILQARSDETSRTVMVQKVEEAVKELAEAAQQPHPYAKREVQMPKPKTDSKDSTLRSYFSPGYAELCSSEERHELRRFYDTEPAQQHFLNRAGHSLQRLFIDFDLAKNSGGELQMHEARCIHGDRLGAWYDTHVAKCEPREPPPFRTVIPWIFLTEDEKLGRRGATGCHRAARGNSIQHI